MLLQPPEHSNYRQGVRRMRRAHLLVLPTRLACYSFLQNCSFALTPRPYLPDQQSETKSAKGLWRWKWGPKCSRGSGGWKGHIRPLSGECPSRTQQIHSRQLCAQWELGREGKGGKQAQHSPPSHSINIRIFLCPQLCYYTCTFLCWV